MGTSPGPVFPILAPNHDISRNLPSLHHAHSCSPLLSSSPTFKITIDSIVTQTWMITTYIRSQDIYSVYGPPYCSRTPHMKIQFSSARCVTLIISMALCLSDSADVFQTQSQAWEISLNSPSSFSFETTSPSLTPFRRGWSSSHHFP